MDDIVHRLAGHKTLGAAPREELAWLASRGTLRRMSVGDVLTAKSARVEGLYVVLSGRLAIFVDRGSGLHKAVEWGEGDVTGLLPYSRLVAPPGDVVAQEPTEIFAVGRDHLPALIRDCHEVTSILVHKMLDRARLFTSNELHDEKMISLGKLSAGLAHELNNPASAIERSAALLEDRLEEAERAAQALGSSKLTEPQLAALDRLRDACLGEGGHRVLSPVEQAEREDGFAGWLEAHALDTSLAGPLADTGVTLDGLNEIAQAIDGPALETVLRWAAAGCAVRGLASDIQEAAMRIGGLVAAVKGFTHMDQAVASAPVDVAFGVSNTIAVLKSKARGRSVAVALVADPDLPRALGFAGELNQIWGNLIDNAIDAASPPGRVEITVKHEQDQVVVRVIDNGPGIPTEIRERIFDPFFTTKPVGQGTGLGLDIVRRLLNHNDAAIELDTRPGRTEFRVLLPAADSGTTRERS